MDCCTMQQRYGGLYGGLQSRWSIFRSTTRQHQARLMDIEHGYLHGRFAPTTTVQCCRNLNLNVGDLVKEALHADRWLAKLERKLVTQFWSLTRKVGGQEGNRGRLVTSGQLVTHHRFGGNGGQCSGRLSSFVTRALTRELRDNSRW